MCYNAIEKGYGTSLEKCTSNKMLRYKYNIDWEYLDIYDGETKLITINYVKREDYEKVAENYYKEYVNGKEAETRR